MATPKRYFEKGHFYHVMTKSIAGYIVFRSKNDYTRMLKMIEYYSYENVPLKFSRYFFSVNNKNTVKEIDLTKFSKLVDIISYCLMPTHIHILLTPLKDNAVSIFMGNLLNSYTRYFNTKTKRKGPLWQGRFKSVNVETDEQLLHLTRYIHLNPSSSGLVKEPEIWSYSSYKQFLGKEKGFCSFEKYIHIEPEEYREFVDSRKDYQRELSLIRSLTLE